MATPLSAARLVQALRREHLRVVEHPGWQSNNRNHKGAWGPVHGVMIHHTVTSGTDHSVDLCFRGHSALPGPLCHGVIDKAGTVHLVGNGRANHAGMGDDDVLAAVIAERPLPPDNEANTDGNARFYGFECINLGDGKDPWPAAQLTAIEKASAAICRAHGWAAGSVIGHLEWQPGKVDPKGFSMSTMRGRIAKRLAGEPDNGGLSMNKTEVYNAVWRQDRAKAPSSSTTIEDNPTWAPENLLRELYDRVAELTEKVDGLRSEISNAKTATGR